MGFETKEEAIEAWNTWRGRYDDIDPNDLVSINPCNFCSQLTDESGHYVEPEPDDMACGIQMHINGAMVLPWPRVNYLQTKTLSLSSESISIADVFKLRARWCALFKDANDYREQIIHLIRNNDRDNASLNKQLLAWNTYLDSHGFVSFTENDLRGINLSGLILNGADFSGIYLRNVDLSFSELSVAQLNGANLYGAKINHTEAFNASFKYAIMSSIECKHTNLSRSYFNGTDLSYSNFYSTHLHETNFNGTKIHNSTFELCNMSGAHLNDHERFIGEDKKTYKINADNMRIIDSTTDNITCKEEIRSILTPTKTEIATTNTLWSAISSSTELKPGVFGFSFNIKAFYNNYIANLFKSK